MNLFGTLCVIALASVALGAVEDVVVLDTGRMEMYSSMCSSEPHGNLKADPFDCTQFIQCDYGKAAVKKCSQGLRYDTKLSVCNWEHLVQCGSTNPGVIQPNPDGPVRCFGYDTLHFIADTSSCQKYYICANGIPYPHQCAPGIIWDYLHNQCEYPEKAHCAGKGDNIENTSTETTPPTTLAPTTIPVTEPAVEEVPDCSTGKQAIACTDSCSEYFICIGGLPYKMKCPDQYYWNDAETKCDVPANARCMLPHK